jgi:hypothetical protein
MAFSKGYDPRGYWGGVVSGGDDRAVDQVGHPEMGRAFNLAAYRLRRMAVLAALSAAGRLSPPPRLFEAGYGVGFYLSCWQALGYSSVAGIDISKAAWCNVSHRYPECDLRWGDIAQLDASADWHSLEGSFDVVTAIDVLYHVVDEDSARRALVNLASLLHRDGVLLLTDKLPSSTRPIRETHHVVRRPLTWYECVLQPYGLEVEAIRPVFWCMDPPTFSAGHRLSAALAYSLWATMRLLVRYLPRNSRPQNAIGGLVGGAGGLVDNAVLRFAGLTPNLSVVTFRSRP